MNTTFNRRILFSGITRPIVVTSSLLTSVLVVEAQPPPPDPNDARDYPC
jgi:hypothetical protein